MQPLEVAPIPLLAGSPLDVEADWLVVPVFEADGSNARDWLDPVTGGAIGRALAAREFTGKLYELFLATVTMGPPGGVSRIALVGAGPQPSFAVDRARRLATASALGARDRRVRSVAFLLSGAATTGDEAQAVAEGLTLAEFDAGIYKTDPDARKTAPSFRIVLPRGAEPSLSDTSARVARGRLLGACTNMARELANEPANRLTPQLFGERVADLSDGTPLALDVLDERRIAALGMGLLLGVAQGSQEPPRVVALRYDPADAVGGPVLGLVGKGVTFDTGGISIKPADGMHRMKTDMSGGAAVVAAMHAIAILQPAVRVVGVVPLAENMPGGHAIRPGDVIRGAEGKTVEVLDTDAEGRLLLADGLWYARHLGATHLVDVATLTGACQVALGRTTSGLFGGPDWWTKLVGRTADRAGDRTWLLPTFEDYRELLRSEIADLVNVGGRAAGAITAAMFLKEFTGGLPWAHLDVAGTAWVDDPQPYQPKGPTGVGVRALAELALTHAEWPAESGPR